MEGGLLLPLYLYRFIRLDFVTINSVVILDYTIIILGGTKMTVLKVEDMHCGKCVERITKAMTAAELDFKVSLEEKTVTIDGCGHCVKSAVDILDDLGFEGIPQ